MDARLLLDGTYSIESAEECVKWFLEVSRGCRVLVFYCLRDKSYESMPKTLSLGSFNHVWIAPPDSSKDSVFWKRSASDVVDRLHDALKRMET